MTRAEPLPAELERRTVVQHQTLGAPADALTGLDHGRLVPERHKPPGGGQSGQPGADHDDVAHPLAFTACSLLHFHCLLNSGRLVRPHRVAWAGALVGSCTACIRQSRTLLARYALYVPLS